MNSSDYSRNDTDYHQVLLTWASLWPQATADHVITQVRQLKGCISVRVYISAALAKTLMHVLFDESLEGFKRDFFTYGRRARGANLLIKCEVPVPWSKCLHGYELKKQLAAFFADCADPEIKGGPEAHEFYRDWQSEELERKRDKKIRYKREMQMLSKEERAKVE